MCKLEAEFVCSDTVQQVCIHLLQPCQSASTSSKQAAHLAHAEDVQHVRGRDAVVFSALIHKVLVSAAQH